VSESEAWGVIVSISVGRKDILLGEAGEVGVGSGGLAKTASKEA